MVVLDASAVLALLNDEPGAEIVEDRLDAAMICSVNLAEVAAGLAQPGNSPVQVRSIVAALALPTHEADGELALDAGLLRNVTKSAGLSLGDRFCLALGRRLAAPVVTADREWQRVAEDVGVELVLIR